MIYNDTSPTTLFGLKQDIYFKAHCDSNSISDGDMNRIINKYYGQLQEAVRAVNENFYMVQATADLTVSDGTYTFPDGIGTAPPYEKVKSIWVAMQPKNILAPLSTEYMRAIIVDPDSVSTPGYTFSTPTALIFGTYFILLPLVTDITKYPVVNGVKMYYIATQNQLVVDGDVPKIFPSFHNAITEGALIDVATRLGNQKLHDESEQMFIKRLEDIKSYASARIPDESAIVEGQDSSGGWCFPFGNTGMA